MAGEDTLPELNGELELQAEMEEGSVDVRFNKTLLFNVDSRLLPRV